MHYRWNKNDVSGLSGSAFSETTLNVCGFASGLISCAGQQGTLITKFEVVARHGLFAAHPYSFERWFYGGSEVFELGSPRDAFSSLCQSPLRRPPHDLQSTPFGPGRVSDVGICS
jgi:hypothetical protein